MRIFRYTITNPDFLSVDWKTATGKLLIRIDGDNVRLGYDQQLMNSDVYFTLAAGQTFVFDQPVSLGSNELLYLQSEGLSVVEVLLTNYGGDY
tara:strand:+ start:1416 stop:1694 length:279 start_codon:yes stop_codon:yes gene_type:complete